MQLNERCERNTSNAGARTSVNEWNPPAHVAPAHASDPLFLGHALTDYQAHTGLGDRTLAARLGCSRDSLPRLALRRCPRLGTPSYGADLTCIQRMYGADPQVLNDILLALAEIHRRERSPPPA